MIILKRLYSTTSLFDPVEFHSGINVIIGKYSNPTSGKEINGIGKSSLIRLLDYAFLGNEVKKSFDVKLNELKFLKGHDFILEFEINGKRSFIRRYFDEPKTVLFGYSENTLSKYSEEDLRVVLGNLFFKITDNVILDVTFFRNLMRFFIKDDLNHHGRKDPTKFMHTLSRKSYSNSYNLYLMGLPNKELFLYDRYSVDLKKQRDIKNELVLKLEQDTGKSVDEYQGELVKIETQITEYEKSIKTFEFYESYKEIEKRLIYLSRNISDLLFEKNTLQRKLKQYQESYEIKIEVDVEKIKNLYSELNQELGTFVKKTLQDIIDFRNQIAENRQKFLLKGEYEINHQIEVISEKISNFENERSRLFKLLDEQQALDSLKNTYQLLVEEKSDYERNVNAIRKIKDIDRDIAQLNSKITKTVNSIIEEFDEFDEEVKKITKLFNEVVEKHLLRNQILVVPFLIYFLSQILKNRLKF